MDSLDLTRAVAVGETWLAAQGVSPDQAVPDQLQGVSYPRSLTDSIYTLRFWGKTEEDEEPAIYSFGRLLDWAVSRLARHEWKLKVASNFDPRAVKLQHVYTPVSHQTSWGTIRLIPGDLNRLLKYKFADDGTQVAGLEVLAALAIYPELVSMLADPKNDPGKPNGIWLAELRAAWSGAEHEGSWDYIPAITRVGEQELLISLWHYGYTGKNLLIPIRA